MTVQTEFFNYQSAGTDHPLYGKGSSPNLKELQSYLNRKYGYGNAGIYGIRNIRGGTSLSTHAFGAALDTKWALDPNNKVEVAAKRQLLLNEVIPFLINNSKELGIQAIHDYYGCRIWRSDRPGDQYDRVWMPQTPSTGTGMGQEWATWLHIEVHPKAWDDARDVETKIGVFNFPPFVPEWGLFSLWPLATNKPLLTLGAKGDAVKYMQGVFRTKLNYGIVVDGNFGTQTQNFVKWFQNANGLVVDGVVGPKTWAKIDAIAIG